MKQKFRLYQRGSNGRYYIEDNETGKQESLGTSDIPPDQPEQATQTV